MVGEKRGEGEPLGGRSPPDWDGKPGGGGGDRLLDNRRGRRGGRGGVKVKRGEGRETKTVAGGE